MPWYSSLVLACEPRTPPLADGPMITSFVFRVRNVPVAPSTSHGGFATNGVNMTTLESYQLGGTFFAIQFYADVRAIPRTRRSPWRWRNWRSSPSTCGC